MPRNKIKPHPALPMIRQKIRQYLTTGRIKKSVLAAKSGVPQYQISRILLGRTKTITPHVAKICQFANISILAKPDQLGDNPNFQEALARLAHADPDTVEIIATLIEALVPALQAIRAQR